jgi:hypothetical protein
MERRTEERHREVIARLNDLSNTIELLAASAHAQSPAPRGRNSLLLIPTLLLSSEVPTPPTSTPVSPVASLKQPPTIVVTEQQQAETDVDSEAMRIAAWAGGLTASLGSAMDPATTLLLEQMVHTATQQAASARNPKLEVAIAQLLHPKPLSRRPRLVCSLAALPTIWSLPLSPLLIPRPRRHGRSIPFCDFDGRKRPPGRVCASK